MEIGSEVIWTDENNIERICEIISVNKNKSYDILLPERNVMFESIYEPYGPVLNSIKTGDTIIYKTKDAIITKIDWSSNSLQIRIIEKNIS